MLGKRTLTKNLRPNKCCYTRGGLDILFANCPKLDVAITATGERSAELDAAGQSRPSISVATLITHLSEKMMKDSRKDLFVVDGHM